MTTSAPSTEERRHREQRLRRQTRQRARLLVGECRRAGRWSRRWPPSPSTSSNDAERLAGQLAAATEARRLAAASADVAGRIPSWPRCSPCRRSTRAPRPGCPPLPEAEDALHWAIQAAGITYPRGRRAGGREDRPERPDRRVRAADRPSDRVARGSRGRRRYRGGVRRSRDRAMPRRRRRARRAGGPRARRPCRAAAGRPTLISRLAARRHDGHDGRAPRPTACWTSSTGSSRTPASTSAAPRGRRRVRRSAGSSPGEAARSRCCPQPGAGPRARGRGTLVDLTHASSSGRRVARSSDYLIDLA